MKKFRDKKPPFIAQRILNVMLPDERWKTPLGDFEEFYRSLVQKKGIFMAKSWYWGQILDLMPRRIANGIYWRFMMIRNTIKIALRNIRKHKGYSFINIFGLAMGMACCLLILLWVQYEFSYDRFHENRNEIYRTWSRTVYTDGREEVFTGSFYPLAKVLRNECPDVVNAIRWNVQNNALITYIDKRFSNNTVGFADPGFFQMFSFSFIQGDPETALSNKFSIVITEEMGLKMFGSSDPLGQTLNMNNQLDLQVTGVIQNVPKNSTAQFDCVIPFVLLFGQSVLEPDHWGGNPLTTFVLLHENTNAEEVGEKITEIVLKHIPLPPNMEASMHLQPFARIHLYDVDGGGLIQSITIFSIIAAFVLIIACINFMNLTTARAANRAGEVGLRKVVGAKKGDLIKQFFGESILISLITLIFAMSFVSLFLPFFNKLLGKQLPHTLLFHPLIIVGFLSIAIFTGILSGSYPSLFLSSFQPVTVLKSTLAAGAKSALLRKILVVSQFTLSIFLIIGTTFIYRQLNFIRNKDLGFDKENIVGFYMRGEIRKQYDSFRSELLRNPNILYVTRSMQHPANIASSVRALDWEGKTSDDNVMMNFEYVDYDYFEAFGMEMVEGRSFSREFATDLAEGYIVNEEAVKLMGLESPVGKRLSVFRKEGRIIGVVKNFHFRPFSFTIQPFVIGANQDWGINRIFIKIRPESKPETLDYIENLSLRFSPDFPVQLRFFTDDMMNWNYSREQLISKIAGYFTFLAILISCLGLFGLASFTAEQRTKEIGIRKVLGASESKMVFMLTRDFTKWVVISNIIAWPAAYFVVQKLLEKYVYRTPIGIEIFLLSGVVALIIALLTVSFQAMKAAQADPVESLRYE